MKTFFNGLFLGLAACLLSSCAVVRSDRALGEPLALEADDWSGRWESGGSDRSPPLYLRVLDPAGGILQVSYVEEEDGVFEMKQFPVEVTTLGDDLDFFNVKEDDLEAADGEDDGEESPYYHFALFERNSRDLFFWFPNASEFRALVESGVLRGTISDGDVALDGEQANLADALASREGVHLWDWRDPTIMWRLEE